MARMTTMVGATIDHAVRRSPRLRVRALAALLFRRRAGRRRRVGSGPGRSQAGSRTQRRGQPRRRLLRRLQASALPASPRRG